MFNSRIMRLIREMPKGENHIHIEGSIPARTALRLAERNKIELPFDTPEGMTRYIMTHVRDLNSFMVCNRMINGVCVKEQDFYEVVFDLGQDAYEQNIIYQELHLDYPLNGERGIPLDIVMKGYDAGRDAVKKQFGVELVFIAGIDRTLSSTSSEEFVRSLEPYLDIIDGLGMDCEEKGNPCIKHKKAYQIGEEMGLFLTAHAGEDDDASNIWDALNELGCHRIDHGVRAIDDETLMQTLVDKQIMLAICTRSNAMTNLFPSPKEHPLKEFMNRGIVCSISSDDPPYVGNLIHEYEGVVEYLNLGEEDLIDLARNSLKYSIKGHHLLPTFEEWVNEWKASHSTEM